MNEINTTTSFQGTEVPPAEEANGTSSHSYHSSSTETSINPRAKVLERKNGMIAGVACGIADYFEVDATVVRLFLVALALLTGPAIPLAYIVAWIIIPEEGEALKRAATTPAHPA